MAHFYYDLYPTIHLVTVILHFVKNWKNKKTSDGRTVPNLGRNTFEYNAGNLFHQQFNIASRYVCVSS